MHYCLFVFVEVTTMDLSIPKIFGSLSDTLGSPAEICGSSSINIQQLLLAAYAPKISVLSSALADSIASSFGNINTVHELFTYFENVFAYGSNYNTPIYCPPTIEKSGVITSLTGTGCVRFVGDIFSRFGKPTTNNYDELFDLKEFSENLKDYVRSVDENINDLNDSIDYQTFGRKYKTISTLQNSIYLKLISLINLRDTMSSFETFTHPIMQLIVISGKDAKEDIEKLVTSLGSLNLPRWYDKSTILQHILILVDQDDSPMLQSGLKIQEDLKIRLGKTSTIVPIDFNTNKIKENDPSNMNLLPSLFSKKTLCPSLTLSKDAFNLWRRPLQEIISKEMLFFMNTKIKQWNDEVVVPRTSLTGRLFGGRKWGTGSSSNKSSFFSFGSNQSSSDASKETSNDTYNIAEGYYYAESQEMILRKLGDWYFMLGDYKNAYTIYGLVKKNMISDKAYAHLSSLQEYSVYALLLGASGKLGTGAQAITPKMISTVITPMLDSSFYSYLSRCNLKTYTLRLTILAAELYFHLGQTTISSIASASNSYIETYFSESIVMFKKVIDSELLDNLSNAYLMQRMAYVYLSYDKHMSLTAAEDIKSEQPSYYESENPCKLFVSPPTLRNFGLSRNRRFLLWLLLSVKELNPLEQPMQSQLTVWRLDQQLEMNRMLISGCEDDCDENFWLQREGGLLYKIKDQLKDLNVSYSY